MFLSYYNLAYWLSQHIGLPDVLEGHQNIIIGSRLIGDLLAITTYPNTTPLSPAEELTQKALADINSVRKFRNTQRSVRRLNGEVDVSSDEHILSKQQLSDSFSELPKWAPMLLSLPAPTVNKPLALSLVTASNPTVDLPINSAMPPFAPNTSWTFSVVMVAVNTQKMVIHAIPAPFLTMFQHWVYVPLSFFLIKSMEHTRLECDIKSIRPLTKLIHHINASNFINKRKLMFTQFNQAYHNFFQCLKLCCKSISSILEGWKNHFDASTTNGATFHPRWAQQRIQQMLCNDSQRDQWWAHSRTCWIQNHSFKTLLSQKSQASPPPLQCDFCFWIKQPWVLFWYVGSDATTPFGTRTTSNLAQNYAYTVEAKTCTSLPIAMPDIFTTTLIARLMSPSGTSTSSTTQMVPLVASNSICRVHVLLTPPDTPLTDAVFASSLTTGWHNALTSEWYAIITQSQHLTKLKSSGLLLKKQAWHCVIPTSSLTYNMVPQLATLLLSHIPSLHPTWISLHRTPVHWHTHHGRGQGRLHVGPIHLGQDTLHFQWPFPDFTTGAHRKKNPMTASST